MPGKAIVLDCWAEVNKVHNYSSAFWVAFLGDFLEAARAVTRLGCTIPALTAS